MGVILCWMLTRRFPYGVEGTFKQIVENIVNAILEPGSSPEEYYDDALSERKASSAETGSVSRTRATGASVVLSRATR